MTFLRFWCYLPVFFAVVRIAIGKELPLNAAIRIQGCEVFLGDDVSCGARTSAQINTCDRAHAVLLTPGRSALLLVFNTDSPNETGLRQLAYGIMDFSNTGIEEKRFSLRLHGTVLRGLPLSDIDQVKGILWDHTINVLYVFLDQGVVVTYAFLIRTDRNSLIYSIPLTRRFSGFLWATDAIRRKFYAMRPDPASFSADIYEIDFLSALPTLATGRLGKPLVKLESLAARPHAFFVSKGMVYVEFDLNGIFMHRTLPLNDTFQTENRAFEELCGGKTGELPGFLPGDNSFWSFIGRPEADALSDRSLQPSQETNFALLVMAGVLVLLTVLSTASIVTVIMLYRQLNRAPPKPHHMARRTPTFFYHCASDAPSEAGVI